MGWQETITCSVRGPPSGKGKHIEVLLAADSNNCGLISLKKTVKSSTASWLHSIKSTILHAFKRWISERRIQFISQKWNGKESKHETCDRLSSYHLLRAQIYLGVLAQLYHIDFYLPQPILYHATSFEIPFTSFGREKGGNYLQLSFSTITLTINSSNSTNLFCTTGSALILKSWRKVDSSMLRSISFTMFDTTLKKEISRLTN